MEKARPCWPSGCPGGRQGPVSVPPAASRSDSNTSPYHRDCCPPPSWAHPSMSQSGWESSLTEFTSTDTDHSCLALSPTCLLQGPSSRKTGLLIQALIPAPPPKEILYFLDLSSVSHPNSGVLLIPQPLGTEVTCLLQE